jgi:hypothetical protein
MLGEFGSERPLPPLQQLERPTLTDVALLFRLEAARHARVINDDDMLRIERERADVPVACTDQPDGIVDGQELGNAGSSFGTGEP